MHICRMEFLSVKAANTEGLQMDFLSPVVALN